MSQLVPYSLSFKDAATHFGFSTRTFYRLIEHGCLIRGNHYLKIGRRNVIVRQNFINWMKESDGSILTQ